MSGARPNSLAIMQWLLIAMVGVVGIPATWTLWHFAARWWQPPEEQRWANGNISQLSGSHFDEVQVYSLPSAGAPNGVNQAAWDYPNVAVYSAPNPKIPPSPVTLEKLSDTGQAQAIDFLAKNADKADAAWSQLSTALTGPNGGVEKKDPYRADRVLVATVSKGMLSMPGDRVLWSRVFVKPINFEFAGYTAASTDTKTIKIAGIENTEDSKLSLGFGLDAIFPGISKDASAPSLDSSRKTTSEINQQYENLGVDIRPEFLRIIRESPVGGDVIGNTAIDVSMLTDPQTIRIGADGTQAAIDDRDTPALVVDETHLTDGLKYLDSDQAKIIVHPQDVLPHCPLIAKVWMVYELRKVTSGNYHYLEGLQDVSLVRDGDPVHQVEIVRADDIAPAVWSIKRHTSQADLSTSPDLRANTPEGTPRRVVSTDYVTLSELTHWIKAHDLGKPLNGMMFDNAKGETLVPFKNVWNDCKKRK